MDNIDKSHVNWALSMNSQIDFYNQSNRRTRVDDDLDWAWYYAIMPLKRKIGLYLRPLLQTIYRKKYLTLEFKKNWFVKNSEPLWQVRSTFNDDLSKKEFDSFLISAICGFERFYYSRLHFDDIITITSQTEFTENLPKEYMGLPLSLFTVHIKNSEIKEITIVSAKEEIDVTNKYKRYLTERAGTNYTPGKGDVVFDCGSCIGEISAVFAAFVGTTGNVHLFDPIPLHNKYSQLQIKKNPMLEGVMIINEVGVSDTSKKSSGSIKDVDIISPGGCSIDDFTLVSIDDYVDDNSIERLDYIKMDIEGAEIDALNGAAKSIKKFKPKLAISCYHKGSHLWEIPELILKINPEYKIHFEQHLPFECDAIVYATM